MSKPGKRLEWQIIHFTIVWGLNRYLSLHFVSNLCLQVPIGLLPAFLVSVLLIPNQRRLGTFTLHSLHCQLPLPKLTLPAGFLLVSRHLLLFQRLTDHLAACSPSLSFTELLLFFTLVCHYPIDFASDLWRLVSVLVYGLSELFVCQAVFDGLAADSFIPARAD